MTQLFCDLCSPFSLIRQVHWSYLWKYVPVPPFLPLPEFQEEKSLSRGIFSRFYHGILAMDGLTPLTTVLSLFLHFAIWMFLSYLNFLRIWVYQSKAGVQNSSVLSIKLCNCFFQASIFLFKYFVIKN